MFKTKWFERDIEADFKEIVNEIFNGPKITIPKYEIPKINIEENIPESVSKFGSSFKKLVNETFPNKEKDVKSKIKD